MIQVIANEEHFSEREYPASLADIHPFE